MVDAVLVDEAVDFRERQVPCKAGCLLLVTLLVAHQGCQPHTMNLNLHFSKNDRQSTHLIIHSSLDMIKRASFSPLEREYLPYSKYVMFILLH